MTELARTVVMSHTRIVVSSEAEARKRDVAAHATSLIPWKARDKRRGMNRQWTRKSECGEQNGRRSQGADANGRAAADVSSV